MQYNSRFGTFSCQGEGRLHTSCLLKKRLITWGIFVKFCRWSCGSSPWLKLKMNVASTTDTHAFSICSWFFWICVTVWWLTVEQVIWNILLCVGMNERNYFRAWLCRVCNEYFCFFKENNDNKCAKPLEWIFMLLIMKYSLSWCKKRTRKETGEKDCVFTCVFECKIGAVKKGGWCSSPITQEHWQNPWIEYHA